jgi:Ca2+-binding EF-hand superfamily protein
MKKIILATAALALVALPAASWSQEAPAAKKGKSAFDMLDSNKDGSISKEEAAAAKKPITEARFTKMDKDADGKLSKDEFKAAADTAKKGKKKAPAAGATAE